MKHVQSIVFIFFACLLAGGFHLSAQDFARDTSFTPHSAWLKIREEFPQAQLVKPRLPEQVTATYNHVYAKVSRTEQEERSLHMDIFQPKTQGKYPAVILVFGGGWRSGSKEAQIPLAQQIAARGYVTVTVEYRLSPEALYPAAVFDLKAAIRYLRAHAHTFNIDPDRIAISGSSAGGQLASLTGMTAAVQKFDGYSAHLNQSVAVQAIINMDGILDFTDPHESAKDNTLGKRSAGAYWFGATYQEAPEKWQEASPLIYADKDTPPILFINSAIPRFHAGRDQVIEKLNHHGVYTEVHTLPNTPHPFWLFRPWFEETVNQMVHFLDKTLKEKPHQ